MGEKQDEAGLILKLYEMRRDAEFRKAREWFDTEFNPQSAQDIIDIVSGSFSESAYFRMVLTYWEMVAGLVNYGALSAGLVHKTNVEHLRYWAKIDPFIDELRNWSKPRRSLKNTWKTGASSTRTGPNSKSKPTNQSLVVGETYRYRIYLF
jgi:hypothetical protein